jgi:purine-binding chemotaxis protein CheW
MKAQLIFGVGDLLCALPLEVVVETIRPLPVQPLAGAGDALLGIAVIRGEAVPVLDTGRLLGGEPRTPTRFITTNTASGPIAFAAGDVVGVHDVEPDETRPLPAMLRPGNLVTAVGVLGSRPLLFVRSDGGGHAGT